MFEQGGFFIWMQIEDVPGIRWLHIDLGEPTRHFGITGEPALSCCFYFASYSFSRLLLLLLLLLLLFLPPPLRALPSIMMMDSGPMHAGKCTGYGVGLMATLVRNILADSAITARL